MDTTGTMTVQLNKKRSYLPQNLKVESWDSLSAFYEDLAGRNIQSADELKKWLTDKSELESVIQEDLAWRYIRMSCDTTSKEFADSFNFFVAEIEPKIAPYNNSLNKKLLDCPYTAELNDPRLEIMLRSIRKQVEIFREENIPILSELQQKEQQFASIAGAMTVEMDGKEITLQQAANYLKSPDRSIREEVYRKISSRRLQDKVALDALYDELIALRAKIAANAGFSNFRDYMFAALGRFDYTPEDCFAFHDAIASEIMPLVKKLNERRKKEMKLDALRPWDMDADTSGKTAPVPFNGSNDIMDKTISCFTGIHPFLGECIEALRELKQVDLESRKGKAPGGFNYPLYETGVPFIFMNSSNSLRDLVTIVHEGGHAVHSIVTKDLEYVEFRSTPSEVAELASMSMELISMEHWDTFFNDADELNRAKQQHLEDVVEALPWIAAIDQFQHWVYTHPGHTAEERKEAWKTIYSRFSDSAVDFTGFENSFDNMWQKQLHLFQVPFYYIEYGMAQLGAIAIWRNYTQSPDQTLEQYLNALKLGYTATISNIYKTAGVKFDFSKAYVKELGDFLAGKLGV